ncbi:unnamed protein product [Camellia sinensis]
MLSLQYHPDKNKNKGAQEKFAEINNEDEKGNPGFDTGNAGDQGGYTYFTSGPGQNGFNFRPNEWQNMGGGHGSSKSFSFSFGGPGGHRTLKVGSINCETESSFCFQNVLDLNHFEFSSGTGETLPKVLLLSTKKDTPVIWRVLSGLYRKRFVFYDAEVHDVSDPAARKLGVDALPAVVGWLSNGEKHTLKTRISVKDIKSAVEDLRALLDGFEKRNKKAASSQAKKPHCEAGDKQIPLLLPFNFDAACGDTTPGCIIGAFRSSKARGKLETILSSGLTEIIIKTTEFGLQFWGCHRLCSFRCFQASIIFEFIKQIWIQITRQARGGLQTLKGEVCSLCW